MIYKNMYLISTHITNTLFILAMYDIWAQVMFSAYILTDSCTLLFQNLWKGIDTLPTLKPALAKQ